MFGKEMSMKNSFHVVQACLSLKKRTLSILCIAFHVVAGALFCGRCDLFRESFGVTEITDSYFITVDDNGRIWRSSDGGKWHNAMPESIPYSVLNGFTYHDGRFVAVGDGEGIVWAINGATGFCQVVGQGGAGFSGFTFGNDYILTVGGGNQVTRPKGGSVGPLTNISVQGETSLWGICYRP